MAKGVDSLSCGDNTSEIITLSVQPREGKRWEDHGH